MLKKSAACLRIFYFWYMEKFLIFGVIVGFSSISTAQELKMDILLEGNVNIRAIELYDNKVFYVSSPSEFGYVSLINKNDKKKVSLSEEKLAFRTLGQDKTSFYTISLESPAYFYKISKTDFSYQVIYSDTVKSAFYDALHFYNEKNALTFSDPEDDYKIKLLKWQKNSWQRIVYPPTEENSTLAKGEAAFAASNSNIVSKGKWIWVATGGAESNVYRLCRKNPLKIKKYKTPIVQGESSQGAYSIDFYDSKNGIIAGGDYTKPEQNFNNIATTKDGGKTWQIQASGQNAGYNTQVAYNPYKKGKEIVTIGDYHISLSQDGGKTWKKLSSEKGFFTVKWLNEKTFVLTGKNKIVKAEIRY